MATEEVLKGLDLSDVRIIAFATHGLMAGDFEGISEPALVMTPPNLASELDDGLLTVSEIARLKLNADLVVLSACNTASPDGTPGAEGLSGLAKAFFFAGSRALLVSHWAVFSEAAVKLTTHMFSAIADDPEIGYAEAMRRSKLTLMKDSKKTFYAHPMFWAPFVVVGEGGVAAVN
jgi:CHAT domain-containing protein